jgi:hypothetical protein
MSIDDNNQFINKTHREETCYSLPYGGIGFGSHLLTYYSMVMLAYGYRPSPPFGRLRNKKWGVLLGMAQLIGSVVLTAVAIHKCHDQ